MLLLKQISEAAEITPAPPEVPRINRDVPRLTWPQVLASSAPQYN